MTFGTPAALFFCLCTGAALGCLFLCCKAIRILLRAGTLFTAILDVLWCLFAAVVCFLCALALDKGRLRLFQAAFQLLGGWAAVAAFDPWISSLAAAARKFFCKVSGVLQRARAVLAAHFRPRRPFGRKNGEKTGKKREKQQKKT